MSSEASQLTPMIYTKLSFILNIYIYIYIFKHDPHPFPTETVSFILCPSNSPPLLSKQMISHFMTWKPCLCTCCSWLECKAVLNIYFYLPLRKNWVKLDDKLLVKVFQIHLWNGPKGYCRPVQIHDTQIAKYMWIFRRCFAEAPADVPLANQGHVATRPTRKNEPVSYVHNFDVFPLKI